MERTIVRGGPRDLIALAWYTIGFRPRESLVLVGLLGSRRRSGPVVRVDIPPPEIRDRVLHGVVELLARRPVREVVALIVSDAEGGPHPGPRGEPELPHRDLDRWLRRELPRHGYPVFDVLAVGPRTFRPYGCPDPRCCPAAGLPLDDVAGSEVAAHMVLSGRTVLDRETDLIADVRPVPGRALGVPALDRAEPVDLVGQLRQWRELLAAGAAEVPQPAAMLAGLRDIRLRDAVMFTLVPGSGLTAELLVEGAWIGTDDDLWGRRPDDDLAERGRRLLVSLARIAPPRERAQTLAVLAWLAWWCNDPVRGRLLAELALADRPGHRLAGLVAQVLAAGIPPTRRHGAATS